ncbi:MAG: ABC transporter substrate-binding protein [Candidatus Bathyarchaeia archaeon]
MSTESKPKGKTSTYIAAVVLIVIILAGVGYYYYSTSTMVPTATTTAASLYKDTIVMGTTDSVQTTIDPADAYDFFAIDIIHNVGDGLVDYRPGTTEIVPALATDWSSSSDGLTWTFNLRQGVMFPDGTQFNASVVKYSIDRQFRIDESAGPFAGVGYDTVINKTVVTGPYQVQFVLNAPFPAFAALVAFIPMFPVNPNVAAMPTYHCGDTCGVVNYTGTAATENPTGLGPYLLSNWQRTAGKDVELDLTANPNYWNASGGYPKTKNIIIKFYTDATSLNLALQSGAIDIAYRQLAPPDIQAYESNANFKVWKGEGAFIQYLVFNNGQAPFNDTAVRQAVAAAIDRSLITKTVFLDQVEPLYSMIPAGMVYHEDSFKLYGDGNITYAQTLLQSAGYSTTNPLKFTLTYPTGHYQSTDGIASAIKQAVEKTGMIQITLANEPWPNYKASTRADQLQAYIYGWYPDYVDPLDYTLPFFPPNGVGFLNTHYISAQLNELLHSAATTGDPSTLPMTYAQVQQLLVTDVPTVPLFQGTSICVSNPKVGGVVLDTVYISRYWLLWENT